MKKLIEINACYVCSHCRLRDLEITSETPYICIAMDDRVIDTDDDFPDWCPLPDASLIEQFEKKCRQLRAALDYGKGKKLLVKHLAAFKLFATTVECLSNGTLKKNSLYRKALNRLYQTLAEIGTEERKKRENKDAQKET